MLAMKKLKLSSNMLTSFGFGFSLLWGRHQLSLASSWRKVSQACERA